MTLSIDFNTVYTMYKNTYSPMQSSLGENATSDVMLQCQEKKERQNLVQTKLNDRYILCQQEQTSLSSQVKSCLKQPMKKKEERRAHNRSLLKPQHMFWYTAHATTVVLVFIWGEGGGRCCHLWPIIGICHCEGYGFQAVYSGIGYMNQRVWVQNRVLFCTKLINWLKIIFYTRETGIATQKYKKNKSASLNLFNTG